MSSTRDQDLDARVTSNPTDIDAWEELLSRLDPAKDLKRTRDVLERVLVEFPMSAHVWVRYGEVEEQAGHIEEVHKICKRVLLTSTSVEVWMFYLNFLQRQLRNTPPTATVADIQQMRVTITAAFEEAVNAKNVGCAMDAGPIWRAYLEFVNSEPEQSNFDAGQKLNAMRKLYQRALVIPIRGLDALWREYQTFENSKGAITAKKLLDEMLPKYRNATEILKERETVWKLVLPTSAKLPRPYSANSPTPTTLVDAWSKVVTFEKTNPEQLPLVEFKVRVRLAYKRALAELRFYPEMWYNFADFERSVSDGEACLIILREAVDALPTSTLLACCLCDALEMEGVMQEAKDLYESVLVSQPSPAMFIHFMNFSQRQEGVLAARAVFRQARASPVCDSSVYCAAAELEFRANKAPSVARAVYEMALKRFPHDVLVAHQYLDLLSHLNDDSSQRDLFERLLESFSGDAELVWPIWDRYLTFTTSQCRDGRDLASLAALERRYAEAFDSRADLTGLAGMVHRYLIFGSSVGLGSGGHDGVDAGFFDRYGKLAGINTTSSAASSPTAIRGKMGMGGRGIYVPEAKRGNDTTSSDSMQSVPPFLHKLMSILPPKVPGITNIDADFIVRNLTRGTLPPPPPPPARPSVGEMMMMSATDDMNGSNKKRKIDVLGVDGAPMDAFKLRQLGKQQQQQ